MITFRAQALVLLCSLFISGIFASASAATASQKAAIETLRKGDCSITLLQGNAPVSSVEVTIKQVRHHFGFGAAISKWPFDSAETAGKHERAKLDLPPSKLQTIQEKYGETFAKYFEWATPENAMKWPSVQYAEGADNYGPGDFLVEWCQNHDIKVRGHNLFWNQELKWMPSWITSIAYNKEYEKGQKAIDDRIKGAMTRYKGKCAHWDIINEIIHGWVPVDTTKPDGEKIGALKAVTGREDQDIFSYVLNESAKIDSETKFCINDFNLISKWSDKDKYISMVNSLITKGCKVDIIGCEGHFGDYVNESDFMAKINDIANRMPGKEIWITESDFEGPDPAGKLETLMTAFFAHERIGGYVTWCWWEGARWRSALTSYLVDSNFVETAVGAKWRQLVTGWTTPEQKLQTDANGKLSFKGFYGKYAVSFIKDGITYEGTATFEPKANNNVSIQIDEIVPVVNNQPKIANNRTVIVNNSAFTFSVPASETRQLYLSAFSISGKLLARVPLTFQNGISAATQLPAGFNLYRIGTGTTTYHTTMGLNIH